MKVEKRLFHRQTQICRQLLFPETKLVIENPSQCDGRGNCVWVNSAILRRFFSRHDSLDDIFSKASRASDSAILSNEPFLCGHGGLHPRVACKGKLLPREVYNIFETIFLQEYKMFLCDEMLGHPVHTPTALYDFLFIEDKNLSCKQCGLSYQCAMKEKLEKFKVCMYCLLYYLRVLYSLLAHSSVLFYCPY